MNESKREKRYGLGYRLLGLLCCLGLMAVGLVWWIAGFSIYLGAAAALALAGLVGPAAAESSGGILEFISGLIELIGEIVGMIVDAICGLFSGFG
ncbi:MAG: hypothetical protein JJU31_12665 [Wenzhouxiangella sp.]|nr:hypothetical protein [Wenzhouxiangella sp.]TVR92761.1 MAG: hypothetical protein EA418_12915 [Wenzhouxiangellaceae bacterium]